MPLNNLTAELEHGKRRAREDRALLSERSVSAIEWLGPLLFAVALLVVAIVAGVVVAAVTR